MSRNRVVRQAVADDSLPAMAARAQEFMTGNGRYLGIGAGVVVVAVAGFLLFQGSVGSAEKAASAMLAESRLAFTQGQVEKAAGSLTTLLQQHGGTSSALKGRLLMGDVELRRNNAAAAEIQFRAVIGKTGPGDYLWFNAQRGLAVSLENQSKFAEAAAAFEALLKAPIGDEEKAHALLDAGRAHNLAGNTSGAAAACDRIIKEFSSTRAVTQAHILKAEASLSGGQ